VIKEAIDLTRHQLHGLEIIQFEEKNSVSGVTHPLSAGLSNRPPIALVPPHLGQIDAVQQHGQFRRPQH
jgi:hypothetical protein